MRHSVILVILACIAWCYDIDYAPSQVHTLDILPDPARCGTSSNNITCSSDMCCSQAGYCGTGSEYCSVPGNCQPRFGWCDNKVMPNDDYPWFNETYTGANLSSEGLITQCPNRTSIALLTYDDGPGMFTYDLLEYFIKEDVRATFFVTGIANGVGQLDKTGWRQANLALMTTGNHLIGSHTWSHANLSALSSQDRKNEMWKNEIVIQNVIGVIPKYFRAPYAECNEGCISDMHELGYHVVGTGWDTGDWETDFNLDKAKHRFDEMLAKLPMDSNLMISQHDTVKLSALELTKHMVTKLKARGFHFGTVNECVDDETPYRVGIDPTIAGIVTLWVVLLGTGVGLIWRVSECWRDCRR